MNTTGPYNGLHSAIARSCYVEWWCSLARRVGPLGSLIEALRGAYPEGELLAVVTGLEHASLSPSAACAELRTLLCLSSDETYAFDLCLRGIKLGLVLREARARGQDALRAAAFAIFAGLSAGAFVARGD